MRKLGWGWRIQTWNFEENAVRINVMNWKSGEVNPATIYSTILVRTLETTFRKILHSRFLNKSRWKLMWVKNELAREKNHKFSENRRSKNLVSHFANDCKAISTEYFSKIVHRSYLQRVYSKEMIKYIGWNISKRGTMLITNHDLKMDHWLAFRAAIGITYG